MPVMIPPALGGAIGVAAYRGAAIYTLRYVSTKRGFQMLGGEAAFAAGYGTVLARNVYVKRRQRRKDRNA